MMIRSIVTALVMALMLVWGGPAPPAGEMPRGQDEVHVQEGRPGCSSARQTAETPGKPTDPNAGGCVDQGRRQVRRRRRPDQGLLREAREQEPERLHHVRRHRRGRGRGRQLRRGASSRPSTRRRSRRRSAAPARRSACRSTWRRSSSATQTAQTPGKPTDPNAAAASTRRRRSTPAAPIRPRAASRSSRRRPGTTAQLHGQLGDAAGPGRGLRRRSRRPGDATTDRPPPRRRAGTTTTTYPAVGRDRPEGRADGHRRPLQLQPDARTSRGQRRLQHEFPRHPCVHVCRAAERGGGG